MKVETECTDAMLNGKGGWSVLARRLRGRKVRLRCDLAHAFAKRVAPTVVELELPTRGCVPVFVDGTEH